MKVSVQILCAWCVGLLVLMSAPVVHARSSDDACSALPASFQLEAQHLVYVKSEHALCLFEAGALVWHSSASHGREAGKKQFEGDERTPEGRYTVAPARKSTRFGLFSPISYPNAADRHYARQMSRLPGGAVGIHGPQRWYAFLGTAQSLIDHSDGCIVIDADGIRELAARIRKTIAVDILVDLSDRSPTGR